MKARIKFRKYGAMRFVGHLDVMRFFQKAMRRAKIPIAFTGGYSPHMIMSFASPLGIGLTSDGEYFDIELTEPIAGAEAVRRLNQVSVEGIEILSFRSIADEKKMTGMAILAAADYLTYVQKGAFPVQWQKQFSSFLSQEKIWALKQTKRKTEEIDIRSLIYETGIRKDSIYLQLAAGSVENLKPELVMETFVRFLGVPSDSITFCYHRSEMYANTGSAESRNLVTLESLGQEIL